MISQSWRDLAKVLVVQLQENDFVLFEVLQYFVGYRGNVLLHVLTDLSGREALKTESLKTSCHFSPPFSIRSSKFKAWTSLRMRVLFGNMASTVTSSAVYPCPLCPGDDFVAPSEVLLLNHIHLVHSCEENFSIQCSFPGCPRTFKNFGTYQNHRCCHRYQQVEESFTYEGDDLIDSEIETELSMTPAVELPDLQPYAARWILKT